MGNRTRSKGFLRKKLLFFLLNGNFSLAGRKFRTILLISIQGWKPEPRGRVSRDTVLIYTLSLQFCLGELVETEELLSQVTLAVRWQRSPNLEAGAPVRSFNTHTVLCAGCGGEDGARCQCFRQANCHRCRFRCNRSIATIQLHRSAAVLCFWDCAMNTPGCPNERRYALDLILLGWCERASKQKLRLGV